MTTDIQVILSVIIVFAIMGLYAWLWTLGDMRKKKKLDTHLWHIDTTYLKPGSKLWCSKGWVHVIKVVDNGVLVVPERSKK